MATKDASTSWLREIFSILLTLYKTMETRYLLVNGGGINIQVDILKKTAHGKVNKNESSFGCRC